MKIREPIEVVRRKAARGEFLTKAEERRLKHFWEQRGSGNPVTQKAPQKYSAASLGLSAILPEQSQELKCFACRKPLHDVTATYGTVAKFSQIDEVDWVLKRFETKTIASVQQVAACEECCTLLLNKGGKTKFKTYE